MAAQIEELWRAPRSRIGVVLCAFALGIALTSLVGTDTEDSSSNVVVVIGALRFPALVIGLIAVMSARYRFRRVHWIAAGVALVCASLQTVVSAAQGLEERGLQNDVEGPAGWAFIVLIAAALVPLFVPAERVDAPPEEESPPAEEESPPAEEEDPPAEEESPPAEEEDQPAEEEDQPAETEPSAEEPGK